MSVEQIACSYVWWLSLVTLCYNIYRYFYCYYRYPSFQDFVWSLNQFLEIERLLVITFCILNLIYL